MIDVDLRSPPKQAASQIAVILGNDIGAPSWHRALRDLGKQVNAAHEESQVAAREDDVIRARQLKEKREAIELTRDELIDLYHQLDFNQRKEDEARQAASRIADRSRSVGSPQAVPQLSVTKILEAAQELSMVLPDKPEKGVPGKDLQGFDQNRILRSLHWFKEKGGNPLLSATYTALMHAGERIAKLEEKVALLESRMDTAQI